MVGGALFFEVGDVRHDESDREAQEPVDLAHPLGVAARQVVVDGDDVDASSLEGVQVDRQSRDESLSFTGLHLGDPAEMERHPAHQLDVEVPLADRALRGLAHHREGLDEEFVELFAAVEALSELARHRGELLVGEGLDLCFQGIDERHDFRKAADLLAFSTRRSFANTLTTGQSKCRSGALLFL